jgi:hypothetical protein
MGDGGMALYMHHMEMSGQLHAPVALSLRKKAPAPIRQEAGWGPELV